MTSNPADVQDIVERLRRASSALLGHYPVGAIERIPADTMTEAADEIERLRAALEFYASGIGHTEIDDNGAAARAALSQEKT